MAIKNLPSTRTILVTNFKGPEDVKRFIELLPVDDIYEHYSIPNIENCFITFFDIRKSILFYHKFKNPHTRTEIISVISDDDFTHLKFTFSVSKNEIQKGNEEVVSKHNQASIIIFFKNVDFDCRDDTTVKFLSQFGEVKDIRLSKPQQKILEFYDFRAAQKAVTSLDNTPFGNGTIRIKFVWDTMLNYKQEFIKRTDAILKPLIAEKGGKVIEKKHITKTSDFEEEKGEETKKIKESKQILKHPFIASFDKFIINHLDEIEQMFKKSY